MRHAAARTCARRGTPSGMTATGDSLQGHDRQTHPAWSGRGGRERGCRNLFVLPVCSPGRDAAALTPPLKKTWWLNSARFSLKLILVIAPGVKEEQNYDSDPDSLGSKEQEQSMLCIQVTICFRDVGPFTHNGLTAGGTISGSAGMDSATRHQFWLFLLFWC